MGKGSLLVVLAVVLSVAPNAAARVTVLTHATVIGSQGSIDVAETNFGRRVQKFNIVQGR